MLLHWLTWPVFRHNSHIIFTVPLFLGQDSLSLLWTVLSIYHVLIHLILTTLWDKSYALPAPTPSHQILQMELRPREDK